MVDLKAKLYILCQTYVEQRIASAKQAIHSAQASANEETKSSAGDKYETGRAMAQLEIEKNSAQLAEAMKLKQVLEKIDPGQKMVTAQSGSIVITNQGNFFICIAAGQLTCHNEIYSVVSSASPLAQKLMGLQSGNRFVFNNKEFLIRQVL